MTDLLVVGRKGQGAREFLLLPPAFQRIQNPKSKNKIRNFLSPRSCFQSPLRRSTSCLPPTSGFALVATLLMIAVITGAAVAFFQSTRVERSVSRNYSDLMRAQMAADSGYALAAALIRIGSTNDDFLVVLNTNRQLFLGNGTNQTAPSTFAYLPLFSFTNNLDFYTTNQAIITDTNPSTNVFGGITFTNILPGGLTVTSPAVSWVILTNSAGRTNARFAFWVEDLAGRLDLSVAGSTGTNASRPTGTNPAELALWSLFNPNATNDPENAVVGSLTSIRRALLTPATARLVNSSAITTNLLADLAAGLIHDTNEPEIIPYGFGYADRGKPKYNLQLYGTNTNGTTNLLSIITNNLNSNGGFTNRSGGMNGIRYLHALAVNIQDYIDSDINPTTNTVGGGPVRGIEPLPFVTETATSIWWYNHGTNVPGYIGNIADEIHLANYVELWNPSDRPFSGTLTVAFSNNYACGTVNGVAIDLTITSSSATRRWTNTLTNVTHPHTNTITVEPPLEPNQYGVFFLGTNIYRFRIQTTATPEGSWYNGNRANAGGFLRLGVPAAGTADSFASTLSLTYGGVVYDRVANIHRVGNRSLYCRPFATGANINPDWAGNVPALRMTPTDSPALPGDPRMGFYLTGTNNAQGYATTPANPGSSMGYRNRGVSSGGVRYETAPNLWLDGGHTNSPLQTGTVTDANFPDPNRRTGESKEYAQIFNNTGTWSNIFELGNIFDPMVWNIRTNDTHVSSTTTVAGNGSTVLTNGGGTTLRIGRAEHGRFTNNGLRASQLLDLFAVNTNPAATIITNRVAGRINLNTATPNVLRALAAGAVHGRDPALAPDGTNFTVPVTAVTNFVAGVTNARRLRPFYSPAELTQITNGTGNYPSNAVFGNRTPAVVAAWSDAAAEEWFSKIYPLASVRSRNFLIHVVAQAMTTNTNFPPRPMATSRQMFQVYAEPLRGNGLTTNVNVRRLGAWTL